MATPPLPSAPAASVSLPSVANLSSAANGGNSGISTLDEASTTSHASSSRIVASNASAGHLSSGQPRVHYQPLSMADALTRAGHDQVRALDELLAERNRFCLEASKLSTENMRLWNLMKRIKRENEDLKAGLGAHAGARGSPMSTASIASSAATYDPQGQTLVGTSSLASLPSSSTLLPSSSTAPALVYPTSAADAVSAAANQSESTANSRATNAPVSFYESATGHSDEEPPLGSLSNSSDVHGPPSGGLSAAPVPFDRSLSSATTQIARPGSSGLQTTSGDMLQTDANPMGTSDSEHSHQHASIMQQRAAAQAQRMAQLHNNDRPTSVESHEFEAIDGSSIAPSDGRSSARASGEVSNKRAVPASPKVERNRHWSSDSSRNTFSPRLDASLLQYVTASIVGTNLRTNDRGREIVSFYISVDVDAPAGRVLRYGTWRVEKTFSDVVALDARLKQKHGKSVARRISTLVLPDQSLFKDHAPSKVDRRKAMLDKYFNSLLAVPMPDKDDLCTFFCTDALLPRIYDPDSLTKDGFLTKKGQNLGRWVTRWYVLSEHSLDYYESRGGTHLGSISIKSAQIGRQQKSASAEADENSYRHAFLILETKPPASPREQRQIIRHVLCAESDDDRDEWVDVLVRAIGEADSREDKSGDETPEVNPYVGNASKSSAPSTMAIGSNAPGPDPFRAHARQTSEGSSTAVHGPSLLVRSPSGGVAPTSMSDARSPSTPGLSGSPVNTMPRSKSEMVGLAVRPDERNGSLRAGNQTPLRPGGSISAGSGVTSAHYLNKQHSPQQTLPPPTTPQQQQYHRQQQAQAANRAAQPQMAGRVPTRSASQDVGSSSSTGHGMSYDSAGALVTPSPDQQAAGAPPNAGRPSKDRPRPSISGPMNGTLIPSGYKFGGGKEEGSSSKDSGDTKKRFWHRFGGGGEKDKVASTKRVFGVPLTEAIAVSSVSAGLELPSVVYRCIEFLEKKDAASEEGIYRLSGSSAIIKGLKDRFDAQGDVNLLAPSEPYYDPHAIAGLLKQFLRELPSSVLTREMHLDFMRVNEITDRRERVNELGNLVSTLPIANYTLLRTLCSHLIKVIERSDVNKMTMRNVGIVFSPTLGIPAGVFALFMTEFDWVFFTDAHGDPAPRTMDEDIIAPDEHELGVGVSTHGAQGSESSHLTAGPRRVPVHAHRNNRNSLSYNEVEADKLLGGPQARNRLSTYLEDFDAGEADPAVLEEQNGDEMEDTYDEHPSTDSQAPQGRGADSLDSPWSPPSHDQNGHDHYITSPPPPEAEITSVYVGHSR